MKWTMAAEGRPVQLRRAVRSAAAAAVAEHAGDMKQAKRLLAKQFSAWDDYVEAAPAPGGELADFLSYVSPTCLGCDALHGCRPQLVRLLANFECTHVSEVGRWCAESVHLASVRALARSSKDGHLHWFSPLFLKTMISAVLSLAAAGTGSDVGAAATRAVFVSPSSPPCSDVKNDGYSAAAPLCTLHARVSTSMRW